MWKVAVAAIIRKREWLFVNGSDGITNTCQDGTNASVCSGNV